MRLKSIRLQNFRQFKDQIIELDRDLTVIHGDNALGKSTILESIFFITNQRSPFTSDVKDLIRMEQENDPYFRIEAEILDESEDLRKYALFQNGNNRQFFIDKHKTTKKKFGDGLSSTIFSPEQIELLMISPQRRREFLDILIEKIDRDYSEIHTKMKKVLKQRNAYLKKLSKKFYNSGEIDSKDRQLIYWSELYSHLSSGVMLKRADYINQMRSEDFSLVYRPSLEVGQFTELIEQEKLEEFHLDQLIENLRRDVAMGHTTIGTHRDDWDIIAGKDIRVHGSRGEKRIAIGRILVKSQEIYYQTHSYYPILMLDDISSELDEKNTGLILSDQFLRKQQSIITTIKLQDIPKDISGNANIIPLT